MFRVKIALLSVTISGAVLITFGLFFLSVINRVGMERIDREIRALGESQLHVWHPPEHWQEFDRSIRYIYGQPGWKNLIVQITDVDHLQLYQSSHWPLEINTALFSKFDSKMETNLGPEGEKITARGLDQRIPLIGADSAMALDWEEALSWVAQQNADNYLGYSDWRLPNAKELHSIVDYTRSPDTSDSAAIDPLFNATEVINEAGAVDYPCYWSGTTHANWTANPGTYGAYVAFGRAMGYMDGAWVDVHGAGAQRSDPKSGDPADYPTGNGPQGDAIRIYNYVRFVRDADL